MRGSTLDRRRFFLGSLSVSAAVLLSGARTPAFSTSGEAGHRGLIGSGHVDDMWGHWPPYAHPIPYATGPHTGADAPDLRASLDPVDRMWGSGL